MVCGPAGNFSKVAALPPLALSLVGQPPSPLSFVLQHTWLGLRWSSVLDLSAAMEQVIRTSTSKFVSIAGLATSSYLPLCYVCHLFESVVDGSMRYGRWLYAVHQGAESRLDSVYVAWARTLLGAPAWTNWATIVSEVGWNKSGAGRSVVDVAMKRCSLHLLETSDLYREAFVLGHRVAGDTWSKLSLQMLGRWGVLDWPEWSQAGSTRAGYKLYVKEVIIQRCLALRQAEAQRHVIPIPYDWFGRHVNEDLKAGMARGLPWHSLVLQRSHCRLRAGLIRFGHLLGHCSSAKRQRCIFCDTPCLSRRFHVIGRCEKWADIRAMFWTFHGQVPDSLAEQVLAVLGSRPGHPSYGVALAWAGSLDRDAARFWNGEA